MKQLYLWISIIAAIIVVVALQNKYKNVYVRQPHYEQQPLVHQFMAVLDATNSQIPPTAYHDTLQPTFKELAYLIHSARVRTTALSLTNTGEQSSFLLAQTLPHLEATALPSWNTLANTQKQQLFNTAFKKALTDTNAVKEVLTTIVQDKQLKEFINSLTSFTDQHYLLSLYSSSPAQQLFVKNHTITLRPELLTQLRRANLSRATLPILNSIADTYNTLEEYIMLANGRPWTPMTLWFDTISALDSTLLRQALTRIYTLYTLRSWLRSPGLNEQRFTPWFFLPTHIQKPFPQKEAPFTIEHLNSAQIVDKGTFFFRYEELLKNIVHELLHGLSLDQGININQTTPILAHSYAIEQLNNEPLLLKEAYIEGLTHIIHALYTASEQPGSTFEGRLANLWSLEKSFAFYQSAKMLFISGFESLDQFLTPQETKKRVTQTTPAAEYHLLKTALIHRPEQLLKILLSPRNKQQKLLDLLSQNFADPSFKQEIARFLEWLKKGNNLAPLFTTGRMTVVD